MNGFDLQRVKAVIKRAVADGVAENQRGIAAILGYTESGLSQIINGKVPVSRSFIKKLYELYPNINEDWLLSGEGEMFTTQTINTTNSTVIGSNIKGSGNQVLHNDLSEIKMLIEEMSEQRKANTALIQKKDEQIDRLLSIIEKFQNKP